MAYNVNTDLLRGDQLFVYLKTGENTTSPIAYTTSTSLDFSLDTIDTANKMSGAWTSNLAGQASWTISTDALITKSNKTATSIDQIFDAMVKREAVKIVFGQVGATGDFAIGTAWYEGDAYITSCNVTADNGSVASMSITFTGSGELAKKVSA